jgi:hypothetical protein
MGIRLRIFPSERYPMKVMISLCRSGGVPGIHDVSQSDISIRISVLRYVSPVICTETLNKAKLQRGLMRELINRPLCLSRRTSFPRKPNANKTQLVVIGPDDVSSTGQRYSVGIKKKRPCFWSSVQGHFQFVERINVKQLFAGRLE